MIMLFKSNDHKQKYEQLLSTMECNDCYHRLAAYLLSVDDVLYQHKTEVFDTMRDRIIIDSLQEPWQTGTSRKTTRLFFNLWNNCIYDRDKAEEHSTHYSPIEIFDSSLIEYYLEAVKIRFELT